jgi:hypothetical protein
MPMSCPILLPTLVIADNARLAAQISCIRATPGAYLSVIDGPRLARPDADQEVFRRISALGKVRPDDADIEVQIFEQMRRRYLRIRKAVGQTTGNERHRSAVRNGKISAQVPELGVYLFECFCRRNLSLFI